MKITDYRSVFYTGNKVVYTVANLVPDGVTHLYSYSYNTITDVVTLKILKETVTCVRFSGVLTGTANDVVITVNEEIV